MEPCTHSAEYNLDYPCFDCAPNTPAGDKLRSIGMTFQGGKAEWHDGKTYREKVTEIHENAKRYGNEVPELVGSNYSGPVNV